MIFKPVLLPQPTFKPSLGDPSCMRLSMRKSMCVALGVVLSSFTQVHSRTEKGSLELNKSPAGPRWSKFWFWISMSRSNLRSWRCTLSSSSRSRCPVSTFSRVRAASSSGSNVPKMRSQIERHAPKFAPAGRCCGSGDGARRSCSPGNKVFGCTLAMACILYPDTSV